MFEEKTTRHGAGRKYLDLFTLDEGAREKVSGYEIWAFETGKVPRRGRCGASRRSTPISREVQRQPDEARADNSQHHPLDFFTPGLVEIMMESPKTNPSLPVAVCHHTRRLRPVEARCCSTIRFLMRDVHLDGTAIEVHRTPSLPSPKQIDCRQRQHGVFNVLSVHAKLRDGSLRSYGPSGFRL